MGEAKIPPGTLGETLGLSSPWGLPPDPEPRQFKTIFLEPLRWLLLNQAPLGGLFIQPPTFSRQAFGTYHEHRSRPWGRQP